MAPTGVARTTSWLPSNAVAGSLALHRSRRDLVPASRPEHDRSHIRPLNPRFFSASPKEPPMRPVPMMVIWRIVICFTTEARKHQRKIRTNQFVGHRVMAKDVTLLFVLPPGRSCATRPSISRTDRGRVIARHPRKPCRDRGCTSISRASAPAASEARAIGGTLSRSPVPCDGSDVIGSGRAF